jgi:hypothetical protein
MGGPVASSAATGVKWKRRRWLLPALAMLMLVAAPELGDVAMSSVNLRKLIAALENPLALLAKRSPGNRSGTVVSIKGKARPHERVLSSVRDRPAPVVADIPSVNLDMPVVVDIPPGALAPAPPPQAPLSPAQIFGAPFGPPGFFGGPVFPPGGFFPGGTPPGTTPPGTTPPGNTPPGTTPPGTTPPGTTPPGTTPPGTTPPGTTGTPPGGGPPGGDTIVVPEPSTWSVMIAGLIAMGFAARGRKTKSRVN